jgi:hypothetical protein
MTARVCRCTSGCRSGLDSSARLSGWKRKDPRCGCRRSRKELQMSGQAQNVCTTSQFPSQVNSFPRTGNSGQWRVGSSTALPTIHGE